MQGTLSGFLVWCSLCPEQLKNTQEPSVKRLKLQFKLLTQVGARKESFAFKHAVNLGINVTGKSDKTQLTTFELLAVAIYL